MTNHEKIFITQLQEALHNDTTGQLENEVNQRLQEISQRLENNQQQLNSPDIHNNINAAQQAVAGAQRVMQLFTGRKII
jgi:hypothetical protein